MTGAIKLFDHLPRPEGGSATVRKARGRRAVPLVGVIRNPRSYRNKGREQREAPGAEVIVETTRKRSDLPEALDRFAREGVDYLAISGGDGTVRDVLTSGEPTFGDDWPPLIVLPKGKTNALAADLGAPDDWTLARAMECVRAGSFATRRPLVVREADDPDARVQGFMLGTGVFHRTISLGQDAHRWGAFNAFAVAVTAAFALGQAFLAGNRNAWRQRSLMRLTDERGEPIAGGLDQRYIMLSSTLENFAFGLKPFGSAKGGLKLAVLDTPARRSLLWIPLIAAGRQPSPPERRGYHWLSAESYGLEVDQPFILDGEAFPPGRYRVALGPRLRFAVP